MTAQCIPYQNEDGKWHCRVCGYGPKAEAFHANCPVIVPSRVSAASPRVEGSPEANPQPTPTREEIEKQRAATAAKNRQRVRDAAQSLATGVPNERPLEQIDAILAQWNYYCREPMDFEIIAHAKYLLDSTKWDTAWGPRPTT